jgi:carbon monoxide dehydrogenase subunit G
MEETKTLEYKGKLKISNTIEKTWNLLTDEKSISKIVPGIKSIKREGSKLFFHIKISIYALPMDFWGTVKIIEEVKYKRVKHEIVGSGVGTNFSIIIIYDILDKNEYTEVDWVANVSLSGRISSLPDEFIERTSKKIINKIVRTVNKIASNEVEKT